MGSNFRKDKIGALSEAGGTISLAPSILTIGGRQLETTSVINVGLPGLTANTRYQVFAVQAAGVVSLVVSQNENSVGPVGSNAWRLVGSLIANYQGNFGSFVKITGKPRSSWFENGPITLNSTGTPPTIGAVVTNKTYIKMDGDELAQRWELDVSGAGSNGTGQYLIPMPDNIKMDSNVITEDLTSPAAVGEWQEKNHLGTFTFSETSSNDNSAFGPMIAYDEDNFRASILTISDAGGASVQNWSSSTSFNFTTPPLQVTTVSKVPVLGWEETPIEDR